MEDFNYLSRRVHSLNIIHNLVVFYSPVFCASETTVFTVRNIQ